MQPLNYQVSLYDCASISLLNCFLILKKRENIPAIIIKKIYYYTLDLDKQNKPGEGGTSRQAMQKFTKWFNQYSKNNNYLLTAKQLLKEEVNLNALEKCLKKKGVILARVYQSCEHYVVITKITNKWVYLFDPYYLPKSFNNKDKDFKLNFKASLYNRQVKLTRFLEESTKDFALGKIPVRECILFF